MLRWNFRSYLSIIFLDHDIKGNKEKKEEAKVRRTGTKKELTFVSLLVEAFTEEIKMSGRGY